MFKHYLVITLRSLMRRKVFSFINLFGLAISMSVCLLIILMIAGQNRYDSFHPQADRIFRVITDVDGEPVRYATSPMPLADALTNDYDLVEKKFRMGPMTGGDLTHANKAMAFAGFYAGEEFFEVLGFELEKGDPLKALKEPYSIVLTREAAEKLYPNENPIGQVVSYRDRGLNPFGIEAGRRDELMGDFTITGVMADPPSPSHIEGEMFVSRATLPSLEKAGKLDYADGEWKNYFDSFLYVRLKADKTKDDLNRALSGIQSRQYEKGKYPYLTFVPQAMGSITPGPFLANPVSFRMPIEGMYFLSLLAFLVMISACFNYTNLSIARSLTRAKEIGIRKVSGAYQKDILVQFLGEALLFSLLSLGLAIGFLQVIKAGFNDLWVMQFFSMDLSGSLGVYAAFVGFAAFIGLLAGAFPAFYLSALTPVKVLRRLAGGFSGGGRRRFTWRKFMLVTQFALSLIFITTSGAIYFQLRHLMAMEYGFDKENVINVTLQGNDFEVFAREMNLHPSVKEISASGIIPATGVKFGCNLVWPGNQTDTVGVAYIPASPGYMQTMGIPLVAGSEYSENSDPDSDHEIMINEKAVEMLGFASPDEAIGQSVMVSGDYHPARITGVVKDFRSGIWFDDMGPLALRNLSGEFRFANVKISGDDMDGTLAHLGTTWNKLDRVHDLDYKFLDQQLAQTHSIFGDLIGIIGIFALLAITIACLGLLGMAIFTAESRIKEVGIRKVLGASVPELFMLLSGGFIKLLAIAILVGGPLGYLLNHMWLEEFANRISYDWAVTGLAIFLILLLGILTVGSQTLRVARINPIQSLRDE